MCATQAHSLLRSFMRRRAQFNLFAIQRKRDATVARIHIVARRASKRVRCVCIVEAERNRDTDRLYSMRSSAPSVIGRRCTHTQKRGWPHCAGSSILLPHSSSSSGGTSLCACFTRTPHVQIYEARACIFIKQLLCASNVVAAAAQAAAGTATH